jgi:hypothetical protein
MAIRTAHDEVTYEPNKINWTFHDFYSKLYTYERKHTDAKLHSLLEGILLPKWSETDQEDLNSPFTPEEVLEAIISLAQMDFLESSTKLFGPSFMPILDDLFCKNWALLDYVHSPHYSVSQQKKDPLSCFSSWSLLYFDYKIITESLAKRRNTLLPKIIKVDKTGCIRDRYSSDNICQLFYIIDQVNTQKTPVLLASLDAEKAFNRMERCFPFSVSVNMGPQSIWAHELY